MATFGHLRVSKLPQVFLALRVLLVFEKGMVESAQYFFNLAFSLARLRKVNSRRESLGFRVLLVFEKGVALCLIFVTFKV